MGGGTKALIGAAVVAAAALAALLVGGPGGDADPASAAPPRFQHPAHPELQATGSPRGFSRPSAGNGQQRKKNRKASITDLVTTNPVTVDANASRIVVLSCGRSQGIALDGGVIPPPAPAQVVVTMLSRANPNPPFANSRRNYYVGVRNLDPVSASEFRASLVCAKRIKVR